MVTLIVKSLSNMVPTEITASPAVTSAIDSTTSTASCLLSKLTAEWDAPTGYSTINPLQFLLSAIPSISVISCMWQRGRKLPKTERNSVLAQLVFAGFALGCLRLIVEYMGIVLGLLSEMTKQREKLNILRSAFDAFADACDAYTVTAMQLVCLSMIKACVGYFEPLSLKTRTEKLIRLTSGTATVFTIVAIYFILLGTEGEENDGTFRLGLGRRISTMLQVVAQLFLLLTYLQVHRNPHLHLTSSTEVKPLSPKVRELYMKQSYGALLFIGYSLVSILARAFPKGSGLGEWLQSPLLLHWVQAITLMSYTATLNLKAKIDEEEAKEQTPDPTDEEKTIDTVAKGAEAEAQTDEEKVELLVNVD